MKSTWWSLSLRKIWLESDSRFDGFDNMPVLMFCDFGVKMPIHAPLLEVFWGLAP